MRKTTRDTKKWVCERCEEKNAGSDTVCKTCDYPKDGMSQPSGAKKGKGGQHSWETKGTLRVLNHGSFDGKPAHKVASFDMDGTLVNPKSGAKFPKNRADWVWFHDSVPNKLKELSKEGYRIVIFTNQAGVEKNHVKDSDIMGKIVDLAEVVGVPFQALIACANDRFRKPHLTMWDHYVKDLNGGVVPKDAFYCGDAAGRHKGWKDAKTKKDFSCSDRKFAANCKMNFMTPEEVFLGEKPTTKWTWGSMDPKELLQKYEKPGKAVKIEPVKEQELVILMGPPASGKSTIAKAVFEKNGYVRANNDDHGTKAKCLKICKEALANGKSVVIDNTNSNISVRSEYLAAAKNLGVTNFRCIHMDTPREVTQHLNLFREELYGVKRIPDVATNTYYSRFQAPAKEEGYREIQVIPFSIKFEQPKHREIFLNWQ